MDSKKTFECESGDLLRVELPGAIRGVTISAFEVTVLNVKKCSKEFVATILFKPFSRKRGELVLNYTSHIWELLIRGKNNIKIIPVKNVSILDGYKEF